MKLKILIASLTSCSGCISKLISSDIFPQFLERVKVSYFPFISDENKIEECDIALIEGCISMDSQIELLKDIRNNAKKVYALGTCAAFGGILSLSEKKKAGAISDIIQIDGIIPGCPPPLKLIGNCLIRLIENKEIKLSEKNLCSSCPLRRNNNIHFEKTIYKLNPTGDEIAALDENSNCFLNNGILCLGPITREGCDHICIELGIPCEGCLGPISKDYTSNLVNFLSLINLSKNLIKNKALFYRFSKPKIRW
ncbi:MAG: hypothetical protein ACFFBT_04490 [Promethearchaeota archaeon]